MTPLNEILVSIRSLSVICQQQQFSLVKLISQDLLNGPHRDWPVLVNTFMRTGSAGVKRERWRASAPVSSSPSAPQRGGRLKVTHQHLQRWTSICSHWRKTLCCHKPVIVLCVMVWVQHKMRKMYLYKTFFCTVFHKCWSEIWLDTAAVSNLLIGEKPIWMQTKQLQ